MNQRYQRIQVMKKEYALRDLCAALAVSRSGYYAWQKRKPSLRQQANARWLEEMQALRQGEEAADGNPRMTVELQSRGHACSENPVARLMRQHGLRAQEGARCVTTLQPANNCLSGSSAGPTSAAGTERWAINLLLLLKPSPSDRESGSRGCQRFSRRS